MGRWKVEWMMRVLDIVYLVIVVMLTQVLSLPQPLLGLLVLPLLIIVPYRVGLAVTLVLEKLRVGFRYPSALLDIFLQWCLGTLVIFFVAATLSYFSLFDVRLLIVFVFVMVLVSIPARSSLTRLHTKWRLDPLIYLVLANGLAVVLIFRFFSFPPPFQPGWDIFAEMSIYNKIRYNNFFSVNTVDYSATIQFDLKSPVFPLIEGIVSLLLGADFLTMIWMLPFLMVPLFGMFIYVMTMKMTGNKTVSSLAGSFAVWTGDFSRPSQQIWPLQTAVAIVMLPLIISMVWQEYKKREMDSLPKLVIVLAAFTLFHYVLGFLLQILLLLSLCVLRLSNRRSVNSFAVIGSTASVLFAMLLLTGIINISTIEWDPLLALTGYKGFNISTSERYTRILEGVTPFLLVLSLLALIQQNLRGWLSKKSNEDSSLWATWVFSALLLLFALPISNTHRVFPIIQILAVFLAAIIIETAIKSVKSSRASATIATVLVVILMIPFLSTPILSFVHRAQSKTDIVGNISSFSDYELAMADWLRENTEENTLLISDPTTQLISEALSRRPSLTGMYMDEQTATLLKQAITSHSDLISYALIREIIAPTNTQQILLISGRTIEWAKRKSNDPLYYPLNMKESHYSYLTKFNQSQFFVVLKKTQNQIYAIEIRNIDFESPEDLMICSGNETSGWNPGIYKIAIDNTDFLSYGGSVVLSGINMTPSWHPFWFNPDQTWDLTKYNMLSISLKINSSYALDNPNSFAVMIVDTQGRRSWWKNNISFSLTAGVWQEIKLDILAPDVIEGEVDLAKIDSVRLTSYHEEVGNLTVHIDSITVTFSLETFK